MMQTETTYKLIERVVSVATRELRRPVLPYEVQARFPVDRAEGSMRRYMSAMWEGGRLVRFGGTNARQGYRLPTPMERLAFSLNGGQWPYGSDRVEIYHYRAA